MLKKLQEKWQVGNRQFWIIIFVFAVTGTSTAYLTKAITSILGFTDDTNWTYKFVLRAGMLLAGYWILLLIVGSLCGQWKFFFGFVRNILRKTGLIGKRQ